MCDRQIPTFKSAAVCDLEGKVESESDSTEAQAYFGC